MTQPNFNTKHSLACPFNCFFCTVTFVLAGLLAHTLQRRSVAQRRHSCKASAHSCPGLEFMNRPQFPRVRLEEESQASKLNVTNYIDMREKPLRPPIFGVQVSHRMHEGSDKLPCQSERSCNVQCPFPDVLFGSSDSQFARQFAAVRQSRRARSQ